MKHGRILSSSVGVVDINLNCDTKQRPQEQYQLTVEEFYGEQKKSPAIANSQRSLWSISSLTKNRAESEDSASQH